MCDYLTSPQPFVYGRPVQPNEFLDRDDELRAVFNRIRNGESTAIVGEPHIGKSSLLLKLGDEATQQAYLGNEAHTLVVSFLNLQYIRDDYKPITFWGKALEPLRTQSGNDAMAWQLAQTSYTEYAGDHLEELFNYLDKQGRRFVLLLDELERMVFHKEFDFVFFAKLRALSSLPSFSLITASRLSLTKLNERGYELLGSGGSPLFNTQIEERLGPFDEKTVDAVLNRAGDGLSLEDRRLIRRVAGRHPFLLQAMGATVIETTGNNRQIRAGVRFYERVSSHFDDLWRFLDDRTRTVAVILGLVELGGRALGRDFAFGEIEKVDTFGPELQKLAKQGLAEQVGEGWQFDREHFLLWRGERWTVGTQAFTWWVRDVVIAGTRQVPTFDEWLANKRYRLFLTQEQWDWLVDAVRNAPRWAVRGLESLVQTLLEKLTGKSQDE